MSNILKQFVDSFPTNCLSAFDHFVGLALNRLMACALSETLYLKRFMRFILYPRGLSEYTSELCLLVVIRNTSTIIILIGFKNEEI